MAGRRKPAAGRRGRKNGIAGRWQGVVNQRQGVAGRRSLSQLVGWASQTGNLASQSELPDLDSEFMD
jgi:hypothetical protein